MTIARLICDPKPSADANRRSGNAAGFIDTVRAMGGKTVPLSSPLGTAPVQPESSLELTKQSNARRASTSGHAGAVGGCASALPELALD